MNQTPVVTSSAHKRWAPSPHVVAIAALVLLFLWVYGRFAFSLYFAMDDFINSTLEMRGPLGASLVSALRGTISWSGYRPLTIAMRVLMTHAFGLEHMWGYYVIYLGMHLANTLLTYRIVGRVSRNSAWAFLAAAIVLLLPAHNEAVLWFAANSNVLALFFSLITLDLALTSHDRSAWGWQLATALFYAFAVLSYEVTIVLPLLILIAEWKFTGRPRGRRIGFYALLAITAVALLFERSFVQGSTLSPATASYALNLFPLHLLRGYILIASQMLFLFTSPFVDEPLFQYRRNLLDPLGGSALITIASTLLLSITVFLLALRSPVTPIHEPGAPEPATSVASGRQQRSIFLFWFAWGILWISLLGVAFAGLANRNPENRYTYILSFGMAVSVTALVAWLYQALATVRAAQIALLGLASALLAFYAYTSVSDATDWAAAGKVTRSVQTAIADAIPSVDSDEYIALIGVPSQIGSAYLYALPNAFSSAMKLQLGSVHESFSGNRALREWLRSSPDAASDTYLFNYDGESGVLEPVVVAILCNTPQDCVAYQMARPGGTSLNHGLRYLELYDTANPQLGAIQYLATFKPLNGIYCTLYQDYGVPLDANALVQYPYLQRCRDAFSVLEKVQQ